MPTTNILTRSSSQLIKSSFKKIARTQFPHKRLIGPRNIYLTNTISKTDVMSTANINCDQMGQYIAASILSHCLDGWNFLSRGIDAFLNGDIATSIHLTYYSELRAVMSIMASEGVGIFNKRHVFFDTANNPLTFNSQTHPVANDLLLEWGSLTANKDNVFACIQVNNRTMKDWINSSGHSTNSAYAASVIKDWFKAWSIDLRLSSDRGLRNEMSYRPHFEYPKVAIEENIEKLISIWQGLEPTATNRFVEIDKHLLRIAIEQLYKITSGRKITHPSYIRFVDNIFDSLGESKTQPLYSFILRITSPDNHVLITEAEKDSKNNNANRVNPFSMICRSILLLRFATSIGNITMESSSIRLNLLRFWWEDIALKFGMIDSIPSGIETTDLYADINDSIASLQSGDYSINTLKSVNSSALGDLSALKQFQRTCFWGLGL